VTDGRRTFLALDFDERFLDTMAATGERLRGHRALSRARWVARPVMHATLRFFGDLDEARIASLASALPSIVAGVDTGVRVRATSLDAFPRPRRAHVLVVALADEPAGTLAELARRADVEAVALGLAADERAFRAHLTLARLKTPADVRDVVRDTTLDASGAVTAVTLYASELGPNGPTYTPLARAPLGSASV
jgi:2'-5' RNA ligase